MTADLDPFSGELGTIEHVPQMNASYSLAPKVRYLLNAKAPAEIRFEKGIVHVDALDLGIRQWEDVDATRITDLIRKSGIGVTGTVDLLGPVDLKARGGVQFELLTLPQFGLTQSSRADFRMNLGAPSPIRPSLDLVPVKPSSFPAQVSWGVRSNWSVRYVSLWVFLRRGFSNRD